MSEWWNGIHQRSLLCRGSSPHGSLAGSYVWYSVPLDDVSEMLAHADEKMYSIKHKDTVKIHRVE